MDNEAGPSRPKCPCNRLFTLAQVMEEFEDFSELDNDKDVDYPIEDLEYSDSEAEVVFRTKSRVENNSNQNNANVVVTADRGGRGHISRTPRMW